MSKIKGTTVVPLKSNTQVYIKKVKCQLSKIKAIGQRSGRAKSLI